MTEEMVKLKCECCGSDFERKQGTEEWKQIVFYKWKFKYCDNCFKNRTQEALKRLPEVIKALIDDSKPQTNQP